MIEQHPGKIALGRVRNRGKGLRGATIGVVDAMKELEAIASYVSDLTARLEKAEAERDATINQAYLIGFLDSGEGYNGEYPFEGVNPEEDARWIEYRDKALTELKSNS